MNGGRGWRRSTWLATVGVVTLVLTACSDSGDTAAVITTTTSGGNVTSTTTTSVAPAATTSTTRTVPATTATTVVRTTAPTVTTRPGEPRVTASPTSAALGSRVSISGSGFTDDHWKAATTSLWLAGGPSGCNFYASADHDVRVSADGRLTGSFVVPFRGNCRMSSSNELLLESGVYRIVCQCTACAVGEIQITGGSRCQNVGFTPNSDNVASEIVAYALPCSEAEALIRKVGGPLGPINGAPRAEADGFVCTRTAQFDGQGLPNASYECVRGVQRITFIRS